MKSNLFLTIILAMALVFGMALIGCDDGSGDGGGNGGNGGDSQLVAKWYTDQTNANAGTASAMLYNFEFNGKLTIVNMSNYTWSASGGKVTIYYNGTKLGTSNYSISGTALTFSNTGDSGLAEGTYYKSSSGGTGGIGGGGSTSSHPIVGTSWQATNSSQPTGSNRESIYFSSDGKGGFSYYGVATGNPYYPYRLNSTSFTYTISGNTITLSTPYRDSYRTLTYSGGNTLYFAGFTFTKIDTGGGGSGGGGGGSTPAAGTLSISGFPYSYSSVNSVRAVSGNPSDVSVYLRSYAPSAAGSGMMLSSGTVTWGSSTPDGTYTIVLHRLVGSTASYYKATSVSLSNGAGSVSWSRFSEFN